METVVFDETPLAAYLRDEGEQEPADWVSSSRRLSAADDDDDDDDDDDNGENSYADAADTTGAALPVTPDQRRAQQPRQRRKPGQNGGGGGGGGVDTPPPSPPSPSFAPVGLPRVRKRFRNKIPAPLHVGARRSTSLTASINDRCSRAVASTMSRTDSAQFLEKFRYTIITSHLLGAATLGQYQAPSRPSSQSGRDAGANGGGNGAVDGASSADVVALPASAPAGMAGAVVGALVLAWAVRWVYVGGVASLAKKRVVVVVVVLLAAAVFVGQAYIRQQWLRHVRQAALTEVRTFVARSHDFDSAASAAIAFIKEVELVSRGYRISAPLPPISRMDDRSQSRRCMRLRKAVRGFFADALPKYIQTAEVVSRLAEPLELEMYYHVHDITDFDVSDAMQGFAEAELDDADSIRTLTVLAARFHTLRKILLCGLLALEAADGDESDLLRWTTAVEGLRALSEVTGTGYGRLHTLLGDAETFPPVATPKHPLSPGRERWRSQLGKLNSLSTGIRGLQAKLALLREESDHTLNEADDITELGPSLLAQYESIGQDLKLLVQAWEEGKAVLASGIDRNEKRLSSLSAMLSPRISLSGLTTVDEDGSITSGGGGGGTAEDALRALTGGDAAEAEETVVFEAVSQPPSSRRRSLLTREERLAKMKEERERRAEAREQADASRGMLRELEMVINLRPKGGRAASSGPDAASPSPAGTGTGTGTGTGAGTGTDTGTTARSS